MHPSTPFPSTPQPRWYPDCMHLSEIAHIAHTLECIDGMLDVDTKNKYLKVGLHLKNEATDGTLHDILEELGLKPILSILVRV